MTENEFKIALHDRLVAVADLLLFYHNPCQAKGGACLAGDPNPCCVRTRFKRWDGTKPCEFIGPGDSGCQMPNLECKVWLCNLATENAGEDCAKAMRTLQALAEVYGLSQ